ncbi:hypothetical protein LTR10_000193 [Elasticomyces elasticus]|nr:hypothetical protein LTR10_000193 [Elasticomyces elasticus]KAK4980548.1 hypothetical protein LTR42_000856 [Elasticomyces elasticus]
MMPNFQDPPPYATSQGAIATKPIIVTLRHYRLIVGPAGDKRWGPLLKTYHDAVNITSTTTRPELVKMLRQQAVRWSNVQRLDEAKNRCFERTPDLENTTGVKHPAGSGHEDSVERQAGIERNPSSGGWRASLDRKANFEHTTTRPSPAYLDTDVYKLAHVQDSLVLTEGVG